MKQYVLNYVIQHDEVLLLYRNVNQADINYGKWIGVGGHIEQAETPLQAVLRETKEETGLTCIDPCYIGKVIFQYGKQIEWMYLYVSDQFEGVLSDCDEGELHWIKWKDVFDLNLWQGDIPMLEHLYQKPKKPFDLWVYYDEQGHYLGNKLEEKDE